MITFTQISEGEYRGVYENGVYCCDLGQDVDGFFYCWLHREDFDQGGFHPAHLLRQIADTLDELNEPWQTIIDNDPALGYSVNL